MNPMNHAITRITELRPGNKILVIGTTGHWWRGYVSCTDFDKKDVRRPGDGREDWELCTVDFEGRHLEQGLYSEFQVQCNPDTGDIDQMVDMGATEPEWLAVRTVILEEWS